jgi:hypothetical protein
MSDRGRVTARFYRAAVAPLLLELWAMRHPIAYGRSLARSVRRAWNETV